MTALVFSIGFILGFFAFGFMVKLPDQEQLENFHKLKHVKEQINAICNECPSQKIPVVYRKACRNCAFNKILNTIQGANQ